MKCFSTCVKQIFFRVRLSNQLINQIGKEKNDKLKKITISDSYQIIRMGIKKKVQENKTIVLILVKSKFIDHTPGRRRLV